MLARQSGTSLKRFDDRSSECTEFPSGARLEALIDVRALSARLKCFKNLHFEAGRKPSKRFEELPLRSGPLECVLEFELPEPDRFTLGVLVRT